MADNSTGANGGSNFEDHYGSIVQGISSAFALVGLGFKQIKSYFTPAPQPVPSTRVPTICKHMFDLILDCNEERFKNWKQHYAPLVKYCTVLATPEKIEDSIETDKTTPGEDAKMPIPFRLLLLAYKGCTEVGRWDSKRANECLEKYNELLEKIVRASDQEI